MLDPTIFQYVGTGFAVVMDSLLQYYHGHERQGSQETDDEHDHHHTCVDPTKEKHRQLVLAKDRAGRCECGQCSQCVACRAWSFSIQAKVVDTLLPLPELPVQKIRHAISAGAKVI